MGRAQALAFYIVWSRHARSSAFKFLESENTSNIASGLLGL